MWIARGAGSRVPLEPDGDVGPRQEEVAPGLVEPVAARERVVRALVRDEAREDKPKRAEAQRAQHGRHRCPPIARGGVERAEDEVDEPTPGRALEVVDRLTERRAHARV